jgi:hypothetical protein
MNSYGFNPCFLFGDRVVGIPHLLSVCGRSACSSDTRGHPWSIRDIRGTGPPNSVFRMASCSPVHQHLIVLLARGLTKTIRLRPLPIPVAGMKRVSY